MGYGSAPGPTLKRPCAIFLRLVGWKTNTSDQPLWVHDLFCVGGEFGVMVGRDCLVQSLGKPSHRVLRAKLNHSSSLRGMYPQALTLFGGARFNAWCLKRPFLGECRRDPRHF